jgi:hypothetical protein
MNALPRMSMVEDARICKARARKAWGQTQDHLTYGPGHHDAQRTGSVVRHAKAAAAIQALLESEGPMMRTTIMERLRISDDLFRQGVRVLRMTDSIVTPASGRVPALWSLK